MKHILQNIIGIKDSLDHPEDALPIEPKSIREDFNMIFFSKQGDGKEHRRPPPPPPQPLCQCSSNLANLLHMSNADWKKM